MSKEKSKSKEGNDFLIMGGGVGAYGVTLAAVTGTICPACVIATPALLGVGVYQKMKNRENQNEE